WAWLVKRLFGGSDIVVMLGPSLAGDITRWVDDSNIAFVPNTVFNKPDHVDAGGRDAAPMILFLSNVMPEKGADIFVDSAMAIMHELPSATFILAGATADPEFADALARQISETAVSPRFVITGPVTEAAQKWRLLSEATVLAFPSRF